LRRKWNCEDLISPFLIHKIKNRSDIWNGFLAPLLVEISNHLIDDFKKLYDLKQVLPVEYIELKEEQAKI